ncbi:MAG: YidB family protein [Thermoleophilia bacterium]|nr:YidB family protein [Thermoleophilia bacterium]MDH3725202.1 YidB family protein [Thermoleophilia bacterium]
MGLLDKAFDMIPSNQRAKLLRAGMGMLGSSGGAAGLSGLLGKFTDAGMQDKVDSWQGSGENQPLSADEVKQAIPQDELEQIADEAGISVDEAAEGLAHDLPEAVDEMTPDGQVPEGDDLMDKLGGIMGKLGG